MENEMSLNDFAAQYFDGIEVPSGINLPTHRRELRNLLVAGTGSRQDARLGRRPVAGKVHSLSLKTWRGVLDQHSVLKRVVFTAIALVLVLSLFFVVPPLFGTHGSIPVSASEIALADLRVRATFTASDLQHLGTQEMAGENGQNKPLERMSARLARWRSDVRWGRSFAQLGVMWFSRRSSSRASPGR